MDFDWRSTLSNQERSKYITDLAQILAEISKINGNDKANFNLEKLKKTAEQFETSLYASSSSKELYLDSMRKRIAAMDAAKRKTIANQKQKAAQASQQQRRGSFVNGIPVNINGSMNQAFVNQQAQTTQQNSRQIRNNMLPSSNSQIPSQQQQQQQLNRAQLTMQQQQLINQMKVAEIPRELLQRIPNIPPGVTTWQQITELAQQKRLSQTDLQIAKQVYQMHQQLLVKSKMHQANINRMNNQQMPLQQNPQQLQNVSQEIPNVLSKLNQVFTPAEQKALYENGKKLVNELQRTGKLPSNLTQQQQIIYIKKYMNQVVLKKWQQNMRIAQQQQMTNLSSQSSMSQMNQFTSGTIPTNSTRRRQNSGSSGTTRINNVSQPQQYQQTSTQQRQQVQLPLQQQQAKSSSQSPKISLPRPTEQDMMVLKRINAEVSSSPLRLSNITNQLTSEQKQLIKAKLQANQQLLSNVDNFIPTLYMITKNEENVRQLLQIRMLVKEIIDHASKGIFIVPVEVVDKVIFRSQKYYEFIKEQLLRRHQQMMNMRQQNQQVPGIGQQNIPQNSFQSVQQQIRQVPPQQAQQTRINTSANPIRINGQINPQQILQMNNGMALNPENNSNNRTTSTMEFLNSPDLINAKLSPNNQQQNNIVPDNDNRVQLQKITSHKKASQVTLNDSSLNTGINNRNQTFAVNNPVQGPSLNLAKANGTNNQTPSPTTVTGSPAYSDNIYKEDEFKLKQLAIRKAEVVSRFKHRQEILKNSPIDLFLSTLADCLGIDNDTISLVATIPPDIVEQVNGIGKKKISKAAQKAKDQNVINVVIKENKLIMLNKFHGERNDHRIHPQEISSCFKDVYGPTNASDLKFFSNSSNLSTRPNKRKLEQSEISPEESSGSLMNESKKIKMDSPDDLFENDEREDVKTKSVNGDTDRNEINIWDWNFWETA